MAEFQKIPIYCPSCSSRVMNWNGITKMQIATQCKYCGCYVKFDPEKQEVIKLKNVPQRESSSGARFY